MATENPFKNDEKCFLFHLKSSSHLDLYRMYRKGFIEKIKVNFKFYDVTAWLTNNCNTHIAQYFEMSDFVSVCLQYFPVLCICNNGLLDFNRSLVESCSSTGFSCAFSSLWANQCFWTSGFDSVSIVFYSLSVSRSLPKLYFSHSI